MAKVFHPLGLVSPVTFHGKVFLQKLWIVNVSWDDPLPMELFKESEKNSQSLTEISGRITGPRFKHSFKLFILLPALDDALYTIRIFVVALLGVNTR